MGNIGSFKPIEINGRTSFKSLEEAKQAASQHKGAEAILERAPGEFQLLEIPTASAFDAKTAGAHAKSQGFDASVNFGQPGQDSASVAALGKAHLSVELADGSSVLVPVASLSKDKLLEALSKAPQNLSQDLQADFVKAAAPIISALRGVTPAAPVTPVSAPDPTQPAPRPPGKQMTDARIADVSKAYAEKSKELMEKEFSFAPKGSDKWRLLKAMELLGKLNADASALEKNPGPDPIQDNEAKEVLGMRRGQLEDLIKQLNEKPEVQEAYTRIRDTAMKDCGITEAELKDQADYVLSDGFQAVLKAKPEAERGALIKQELGKIQAFNPDFAKTVAASLSAIMLVDSGFEHYRGLSPDKKDEAKARVEYLIDDLLKTANTNQDKGNKAFRELQKIFGTLPPKQWEVARKLLVNEVFMEEGVLKKAGELDGKRLLKAYETAFNKGTIVLTDQQKADLAKIKSHSDLAKMFSTAAAIGTVASIYRSGEELYNKGLNPKSAVDLVNKTVSFAGATKDIVGTASILLKKQGYKSAADSVSKAATYLETFKVVKFAGPITSAISAATDFADAIERYQKEDKAGYWLKGIGAGAGAVAAVAGTISLVTSSAPLASVAGPVGLVAIAVVGVTAITYNCVKESEETGEFRQALRDLGISDKSEELEQGFQQAVGAAKVKGKATVESSAQAGFNWAKDKPVAERAALIGSLLDQSTDPYEELAISKLFKDAVGKNPGPDGDDFDRLVARTEMRRVGRELQPDQLKDLIATLRSKIEPAKTGPSAEAATKALQQLVIGIAADHEYSLLKKQPAPGHKDSGELEDFIKNMPVAVKKEIAAGLMAGYTSGTGETLLSKVVLSLPNPDLAELLGRGGPDLVKNLVSELPQAKAGELMRRFAEIETELGQAEAAAKANPSPANKEKAEILRHAMEVPFNNFMIAMSDESNSIFYDYEGILQSNLKPELTRHLSNETIVHVCRKLMDTTLWTPDQSSAALVKLVKQTTPEQFKALMAGSTDTFLRKVLAGSTTELQSRELLEAFYEKAGNKADRNFQTIALGMMHQPTLVGVDWSYEQVVKDFIAEKKLDLSGAPALKVLNSTKDPAALLQQRGNIASMSNTDKALIIKHLMQGATTDSSETLIHDILADTFKQDPAQFKELASMVDCYLLAQELGDAIKDGSGDAEALNVFEMLAKAGDPKDFTAYANGMALDRNQNVLCKFTAKPENQAYLKQLPAPVVKEMCESLMKGITTGKGEKAVTMLLKHASDEAFLSAVKDKDFATWLTGELQTNDANWIFTAAGEDDQIKTLMQRLGRMAHTVDPKADPKSSPKAEIAAALESFALACGHADYPEVLEQLATSEDTKAAVRLLSPAALKTVTESLMTGWASGKDQSAVTALLDKCEPQQLRELLGKGVGGQALCDKLANKLTTEQLRKLMTKMIEGKSVNVGLGFSYLAAALAKEHEGKTLKDLIGDKPEIVKLIAPTVLQNMVVSLSKGWTSGDSREAIAGILKNASPEQLELILQSNTTDPKHVSNWVVETLSDAELGAVLSHLSTGTGKGRGADALLGSLAYKNPAILTAASQETLKKFSPESLKVAAADCAKGFNASTLGGDYRRALSNLLTVAEAKDEAALKTMIEGIDLATAGVMLADDQDRFNQVLRQVAKLSGDAQLKSFVEKAPAAKVVAAWPSLRDSKVALTASDRQALFRHSVEALDFDTAMQQLKGVPGSGATSNLIGTPEGKAMVSKLAENLGRFGKAQAIEIGKLVLQVGSPAQIDAAFKQIHSSFYIGRGADVVREVLGSATTEAEKKAIYGKLPKATLEAIVGTMDSTWYKTIGQITGSYSDNMTFLQDMAKLVDPAGKRTMVLALANSWWTPDRAEQLMFDIMNETPFENNQFYELVNGMSEAEIKLVADNLESPAMAGKFTAWIGEAEIRKNGSTGNLFNVAAGHIAYNHWNEAVDSMREEMKGRGQFDKIDPGQIVMLCNKFMDGDTNYNEETCIYKLLEACSWKQFAQAMADSTFRGNLKSELSSAQWSAIEKWFYEIPQHVK